MQQEQSADVKESEDYKAMGSAKLKLGSILGATGLIGLAGSFGTALGFWIADRGIRWFPTMVGLLLVACAVSLLMMLSGQVIKGKVLKLTARGIRVRRRIIFCLLLAAVLILGRLGVYWAQNVSPLTQLAPAKFDEAFRVDLDRYVEYDAGIGRLLQSLESRAEIFDPNMNRVLTADEEKYLRDAWTTCYDYAFALDQIRAFYEDWYRFDPSRVQRSRHVRSFLLTFASELSLYEKSSRLVGLIGSNSDAVKFLDAPYPAAGLEEGSFSRFRQQLVGTRDLARVLAGRQYLLWLDKAFGARQEVEALGYEWLWDKIELELGLIEAAGGRRLAGLTVNSDLEILKRGVRHVWFGAQSDIAEWMGDTRMRRIGVYLINPEQQKQLAMHLEPGDILLSRKNWYLSNVGLPGFWPHAALYIGAPEKFEAYFDDPNVTTFLKELTGREMTLGQYLEGQYADKWFRYNLGHSGNPYGVIEALSEGVVLNRVEKACGDYMAAVRPRLDKKSKAQAIIEAFGHLDKPYDYDFDFATDHALVCTEVVWRSYRPAENKRGLNLKLVEIAGRKTLPANEIARQYAQEHGRDDRQLDFVYFLDASEKAGKAFVSTEDAFWASHTRFKWDLALD
jgi:hypothetical protein